MVYMRVLRQLLNSMDFSVTGNIPVQASTEKPVTESGDRDHNQS